MDLREKPRALDQIRKPATVQDGATAKCKPFRPQTKNP